MPKLFNVDIAGEINKGMGHLLLSLVLTKSSAGSRVSGQLIAGTQPTTVDYSGRGFTSSYKDREINNTSIITGDRKIGILGASLPSGIIPAAGDKVTIEGSIYNIVNVKRDPAAALYTCQGRGPSNV